MIGHRLRKLRESLGLTMDEFANAMQVDKSQVFRWEKDLSDPSIKSLYDLARIFNVSSDYLISLSDLPDTRQRSTDLLPEEIKLLTALRTNDWGSVLLSISSIVNREPETG